MSGNQQSQSQSSISDWNKEPLIAKEAPVTERYKFDDLKQIQFWGYSVGHVLNDLCAACWFNYLLFYLKLVIKIDYGSYAMLSGQVADAIGTPTVGYYSDKTNTRIGKRIPWYIGGYMVVVISFLPVWNGPYLLNGTSLNTDNFKMFYYIFFPAVFNLGWASLQISHMSLVPSLTCGRSRRDKLNSMRNTFQFIAVLTVYIIAVIPHILRFQLFLFQNQDTDPQIAFQYISIICVIIGTCTSVFFLIEIKEVQLTQSCKKYAKKLTALLKDRENGIISPQNKAKIQDSSIEESQPTSVQESQARISEYEFLKNSQDVLVKEKANKGSIGEELTHWSQWFKQLPFYRYGFVYMLVRLYCNVSSTMIAFYIQKVLVFTDTNPEDEEKLEVPIEQALIPLSLYIMSVFTSASLGFLYDKLGKKITLTIGMVLCLASSASLMFLNHDLRYVMYGVAPVIGIAQAITLNTGITLISDVIGLKGSSGAFVFGSYSFLDKISTGIALFLCSNGSVLDNIDLIRWITVLVPSVSCFFGWLLVVTAKTKKGEVDKDSKAGQRKSLQDELAS